MVHESRAVRWAAAAALVSLLFGAEARAHCDGLDGPVVTAAREALRTGDVNLVVIWVQARDEAEIRSAFETTRTVRKLGDAAKDLADRYFFETLVRIHRAGEGAPYTGLKPAGRDLGPAIPAADRALVDREPEAVLELLTHAVAAGVRERFEHAAALRSRTPEDIDAGRRYVAAYVAYVHYVEGIYGAATSAPHGHVETGEAAPEPEHAAHHGSQH